VIRARHFGDASFPRRRAAANLHPGNANTHKDATLSRAGARRHAPRAAPDLLDANRVTKGTSVVVIFPDEFDENVVVENVASLRAAHPRLLILLITGASLRYHSALVPEGRSVPPLVLPKPAFGWSILDAIRAQVEPEVP
jgi:hypothetical protein